MRQFLSLTVLLLSLSVSARADWTKVEANTTANLWGVCYGGGQYVVVGTGGTILTSADGVKWTARTSGTSEWLTAVAYGNNLYVAVGDHGRILTSTDAVTWVTRESSGERLNGIAFGAGRFLAVGENGTVRASTDALTWSTRTLPVNTWLRGVCYGPGGFFIGAADGTMAWTIDGQQFRFAANDSNSIEALFYSERTIWSTGSLSNLAVISWSALGGNDHPASVSNRASEYTASAPMRGITQSGNAIIAVGSSGQVRISDIRSIDFSNDPAQFGLTNFNSVVSGPTNTVIVGDVGSIYVTAIHSAYPNAPTAATITAFPTALFAHGSMRLFASAEGARPFTYQWNYNGQPIAGYTEDNMTIQDPDTAGVGKYSVIIKNSLGSTTAEFVASPLRDQPLGVLDPTFKSGGPIVSDYGVVPVHDASFLVEPNPLDNGLALKRLNADGSWDQNFRAKLASSWIIAAHGGGFLGWSVDRQAIVKLRPDGSLDSNFMPIPEGTPITLGDGRIVSVIIRENYTLGMPMKAELKRYDLNGNADLSYPTVDIELRPSFDGIGSPEFRLSAIDRYADGRIIVALSSARGGGTASFGSNESRLFRLKATGEIDPSFGVVKVTDETIVGVAVVGDKIYCRSVSPPVGLGSPFKVQISRYNADGSSDSSSYAPLLLYSGLYSYLANANALLHDGSVLAADPAGLQLYAPNGQASRHIDLATDGTISEILPLDDGRIIITGTFTSVNGVATSGIARLALATPTHDPATYLANLSIRTTAGNGDQTLITGFVVSGEGGTRSVLARGVGPGLVPLGINARDVVADPQLKLFRGQTAIATNDNWDSSLEETANALGAYPLARDSKDAALFTTLSPGAYTAHVTSTMGASGVALVELYDAGGVPTSASSPRLVNLSGRARVGTGDNVLIAGFVLSGANAKRLLIRAVGPGLRAQGVSDALADPQLTIYRGAEAIATNDDWSSIDQAIFKQVGAFDLASGSKDAAVVADLVPGVYTAVVRGSNSTTGTALVEIYEVP